MRCTIVVLSSWGFFLWADGIALAQTATPPAIQLVRGLRDQGMPDLAMEFLDFELKKLPPDPVTAALLPLERARTRLELARSVGEDSRKNLLLGQAKNEFQAFLSKAPTPQLRVVAQVELGRLVALQGKVALLKAKRVSPKLEKQREAEHKVARDLFTQASKMFESTAKLLDEQIKATTDKTEQAQLTNSQQQAILEQGINEYNLGLTYEGDTPAEIKAKGAQINKARSILEKIAFKDENTPISWIAKAWIAQCDYENQRFNEAKTQLDALLKEKRPIAREGVRQARYFQVRQIFSGSDKDRYERTRSAAEQWLRDYPNAARTPEGAYMKFVMALSNQQIAERDYIKRDPKTREIVSVGPAAVNMLKAADRLYNDLGDFDNEYAERAAEARQSVILALAFTRSGNPEPKDLTSLEECMLFAQIENAKLQKLLNSGSGGKELDEQAAEKAKANAYARIISFLQRGLAVAKPPADSPRDILEARNLLTYFYFISGDMQRAAVMGEYTVMQAKPDEAKAASAGQIAILAYRQSLAEMARNSLGEEEDKANAAADIARLKNVAKEVQRKWPSEPASDTARHQLGLQAFMEKRYSEACEYLSKISLGYQYMYQARTLFGAAVYTLQRPDCEEKGVDPAKIQKYQQQVVAELTNLPSVPPGASNSEVLAYCNAKLQLGQLQLLMGNNAIRGKEEEAAARETSMSHFQTAEKIADDLLKQIPTFNTLEGNDKDNTLNRIKDLKYNAVFAQAFYEDRSRNNEKVATLLEPLVKEIETAQPKAGGNDEESSSPSAEALRRTQQRVLVLALRNSVSDGKIDRARSLLESLGKLGGGIESNLETLRQLVREVRTQINAFKRDKKLDEVKKLTESFSALLDDVASKELKPEQLPTMIRFLASGFEMLEKYERAAQLLEQKYPKPTAKSDDPNAADAVRRYQYVQLDIARNYRKYGAQLTAENKKGEAAAAFAKAEKVMKEIMGDGKVKGWGQGNIDARKEALYLLEDQGKWGGPTGAVAGWIALSKSYAKLAVKPVNPEETYNSKKTEAERVFYIVAKYGDKTDPSIPAEEANKIKADHAEWKKAAGELEAWKMLMPTDPEKIKNREEKIKELTAKTKMLSDKLYENAKKEYEKDVRAFNDKNRAAARFREIYFDLFYETQRCVTKANLAVVKDNEKKREALDKVAQAFFDLEQKNTITEEDLKNKRDNPNLEIRKDGIPPRVHEKIYEFLEEHPTILKKYKELKGTLFLKPPSSDNTASAQ